MTIAVSVVSDYELIENGVRSVLRQFPDRVEVVTGPGPDRLVDVALWSSFGIPRGPDLERLRNELGARRLVVLCWDFEPGLVQRCLDAGASGYLSTGLSGQALVESLERVHAGEVVVSQLGTTATEAVALPQWPGQPQGLSEREGDIVALIATGLSNNEIADQLFLSINTIKSYVRSAYQKMGVTSRSQAVLWAVQHGLRRPQPREEDPDLV